MYLDSFIKRSNSYIHNYKEPLSYLSSRGITEEDILKYSIGYVKYVHINNDGSDDYKYLHNKSFEFNLLRGKIIFPLRNVLGRVNGLVTRSLDKKFYSQYFMREAKDLGAFFGLYEALESIRDTGVVFVHEGAFDCISFAKIFPNTISSLTSFLNEAQYETLKFYAKKIVLVYDNDKAGMAGVTKMKKAYNDKYIENIVIGDGDSNSYLKILGEDKFKSYIKSKIPSCIFN